MDGLLSVGGDFVEGVSSVIVQNVAGWYRDCRLSMEVLVTVYRQLVKVLLNDCRRLGNVFADLPHLVKVVLTDCQQLAYILSDPST